jgi:hypothetical protein
MIERLPSLAAPCAIAVMIVAVASPAAQAQSIDIPAAAQIPAVRAAVSTCMADRNRLCSGILPGGGRIVRCLADKLDRLTPTCRAGMEQARDALIAAGLAPKGGVPSQ